MHAYDWNYFSCCDAFLFLFAKEIQMTLSVQGGVVEILIS
jgi:hypothetical protein